MLVAWISAIRCLKIRALDAVSTSPHRRIAQGGVLANFERLLQALTRCKLVPVSQSPLSFSNSPACDVEDDVNCPTCWFY